MQSLLPEYLIFKEYIYHFGISAIKSRYLLLH